MLMLKRRVLVLFTLVFLCLSSLCLASQRAMEKYLPRLQGNWYDLDGNVVLTFDGASVNGCPVVDILRVAGGGGDVGFTVRIVEDAGYRDLKLSCMGLSPNPDDYHQYIRLDGKQKLRRFPEARYYETIGGLGLGMTKQDVLSRYGQPDVVETGRDHRETWTYSSLGLGISWEDGIVTKLRIYDNGDRHFDRTGFNCANSIQDYVQYYGWNRTPKAGGYGAYGIGYGEYLWFDRYPKAVELSVYWN